MIDRANITPAHLSRVAFVYIRQSTLTQLERNTESTDRQYALVARAVYLGWPRERVTIVDQDLGLSGSGVANRSGFVMMTSEVAMGRVGLVLCLEVSRLARNSADWYRLLDLCGITDTLLGDEDGLYSPARFNDRLLLGLKGTMSEAELHIIRARLQGGIRNKAARGEFRLNLPVGFIWGEGDGEVLFLPDESVTGAIRTIFTGFAELGSIRQVWLWFRRQGLSFPLQSTTPEGICWVTPTYTAIHNVLTNPVYAGAYAYGKTKLEHYIDEEGRIKKRRRLLPRAEWEVLIPEHHDGFIDWETYEANQARIDSNNRPPKNQPGGAVREGAALLQGIGICGRCGRHLGVQYRGKNSAPGYHCAGDNIVKGRGSYCLYVGGCQIDKAVSNTFLEAITPAGIEAALKAVELLESDRDAALAQWRLEVEQKRYEAERAERRYRAVEPENRLVARGLENEWEKRLRDLVKAEVELDRRERQKLRRISTEERQAIKALGTDIKRVWSAPTTTDRDRKELLRTLLEEVIISIEREKSNAHLVLRWKGGAINELDINLPRSNPSPNRTDEDTVDLIRRLAKHYPDAVIAGILNRQKRKSAHGRSFTASIVGNVRSYRKIPRFVPPAGPLESKLVTINKAAELLKIAPSTVHRWLADGFIAGEQITPGAPWRIRINDDILSRFVEEEPEGYLTMKEAIKVLGVSRQTVLQRVKRGALSAVHVRRGKSKGLRIKVVTPQIELFHDTSMSKGVV